MPARAAPFGTTKSTGYSYDAFGNQPDDEGVPIHWTLAAAFGQGYSNPFRYSGEYFDEETGYQYLRARYYDSSIGGFVSEDPVRDGLNWYAYCNGNPLGFVDPSGLAPLWLEKIGARASLTMKAYEQYPWMIAASLSTPMLAVISLRISSSISAVEDNRHTINDVSNQYGVPAEIIGSIIFKEQLTQSLPDTGANVDTFYRNNALHSVGLGAINPKTAREAWEWVNSFRDSNKLLLPTSDADLQYMLTDYDQFNIATISVVLMYYAYEKQLISNPSQASSLNVDDWKSVVARYNGFGEQADEYSNKVYEYLEDIATLLK